MGSSSVRAHRQVMADEPLMTFTSAGPRHCCLLGGVVVWHVNRLHRHPAELEEFIALTEGLGDVAVETVTAGDSDLERQRIGDRPTAVFCCWGG